MPAFTTFGTLAHGVSVRSTTTDESVKLVFQTGRCILPEKESRKKSENRVEEPEDKWKLKDVWLGLLFLSAGALITGYAYLAMRNEVPSVLWWPGWFVGPLFLLLGAPGGSQ